MPNPIKRKFFKTIIVVEVLSEDEPADKFDSLADVHYEITDGHCSGHVKVESVEELDGRSMAQAALAQGTDPGFFGLDEDGNEEES